MSNILMKNRLASLRIKASRSIYGIADLIKQSFVLAKVCQNFEL